MLYFLPFYTFFIMYCAVENDLTLWWLGNWSLEVLLHCNDNPLDPNLDTLPIFSAIAELNAHRYR